MALKLFEHQIDNQFSAFSRTSFLCCSHAYGQRHQASDVNTGKPQEQLRRRSNNITCVLCGTNRSDKHVVHECSIHIKASVSQMRSNSSNKQLTESGKKTHIYQCKVAKLFQETKSKILCYVDIVQKCLRRTSVSTFDKYVLVTLQPFNLSTIFLFQFLQADIL